MSTWFLFLILLAPFWVSAQTMNYTCLDANGRYSLSEDVRQGEKCVSFGSTVSERWEYIATTNSRDIVLTLDTKRINRDLCGTLLPERSLPVSLGG